MAAAAPAVNGGWHVWGRPSVPINKILAVGVYLTPNDVPPLPVAQWASLHSSLMQECKDFHHQQLQGGSMMEWSLHHVALPFGHSEHADDAEAFYHAASDAALRAASKAGGLGAPVAVSTPALHDPDSTNAYTPDMVVFVLFADWGCEYAWSSEHHERVMVARLTGADAMENDKEEEEDEEEGGGTLPPLAKYYVWGAMLGKPGKLTAAEAAAGVGLHTAPLRDVTLAGGSRSCFRGVQPLSSLPGLCLPLCSSSRRVGVGVGLVTQEAWLHPELPGSACVVYHEGLGHALGMPHPTVRSKYCVMDLAQYQGLKLAGGDVMISQEILDRMCLLGDGAGGDSGGTGALVARLWGRSDGEALLAACVPVTEVDAAVATCRSTCRAVAPLALAVLERLQKAAAARAILAYGLEGISSGAGAGAGSSSGVIARSLAWMAACEEQEQNSAAVEPLPSPCDAAAWMAAAGGGTGDVQFLAPDCGLLLQTSGSSTVADRACEACPGCCGGVPPRAPVPRRTLAAEALWGPLLGLRQRDPSQPPSHRLGRQWTETQLTSVLAPSSSASSEPTSVLLFKAADYHFQEVMWEPEARTAGAGVVMAQDLVVASPSGGVCRVALAAALGAPGATSPRPVLSLTLLDTSRDIALVVRGSASWYSGRGLRGPFYWFKTGQWVGGTIAL